MRSRLAILLMLLLYGPVQPAPKAAPLDVSLVQLIANPKDYDGKFVRVIGFVTLEFEGNAVYLHQEDYKHALTRNGLWIDATDGMHARKDEFDQKYLLLEGMFDRTMNGHRGLWSGSLQKISRIQVWSEKDGRK